MRLSLPFDLWEVSNQKAHSRMLRASLGSIFGGEMDSYQRRYDSRDDAIAGHMEAVEKVKALNADIAELERMLKLDGDYTRTGI
jgi:hypothetical protein